MSDEPNQRLSLDLDFWDDDVVAFEPEKVIRQLCKTFPDVEIDQTDHQRTRLLWELDYWSQEVSDEKRRDDLIRSSWHLYQTEGPTYRFVIPFASGHRVGGVSRRLLVEFRVPLDLPAEDRERWVTFLRSMNLGEPTFD